MDLAFAEKFSYVRHRWETISGPSLWAALSYTSSSVEDCAVVYFDDDSKIVLNMTYVIVPVIVCLCKCTHALHTLLTLLL